MAHGVYCNALSPVHTVAEKCDCRRKRRDNGVVQDNGVVSPFSATVALFCDSVDRLLYVA